MIPSLLQKAQAGFQTVAVGSDIRESAMRFLELWLTKEDFREYIPMITKLIEDEKWDYLIDCFYQVIPFGTAGRRGEVGPGPNRINSYTIQHSAQGHSQYLLKKYGDEAKKRGIVFCYDVRHFYGNRFVDNSIPSPIQDLDGVLITKYASVVYAANGIPVKMFTGPRTTPQLSFTVRHLGTIAGNVFSASHNPVDHNGKKVYDCTGGMLIPPFDEELVNEVTKGEVKIHTMDFDDAISQGLISYLDETIDEAYFDTVANLFPAPVENTKVLYSPLHGTGLTSCFPIFQKLGYDVELDPATANMSGRFENITYNIANPEIPESFNCCRDYALENGFDLIFSSDPDADRMGMMVRHEGQMHFLDGNQIATLLTQYLIDREFPEGIVKSVIKTDVTTSLLRVMCEKNGVPIYGDLLVGYKYIGEVMNRLDRETGGKSIVLGCEESHGFIIGNYTRDKDAAASASALIEYASRLKKEGKTLIDELKSIYRTYGYYKNYCTELRMLGAIGFHNIRLIQDAIRTNPPKKFGRFEVIDIRDFQSGTPFVSETDKSNRDLLVWTIKTVDGTNWIKLSNRPSGTEPKSKHYIEIGTEPVGNGDLESTMQLADDICREIETEITRYLLSIIGLTMPDRYMLLYIQIPVEDKFRYFEIEPQIADLIKIPVSERKSQLLDLIKFLGSDPILKINKAFAKKFGKTVEEYLSIT